MNKLLQMSILTICFMTNNLLSTETIDGENYTIIPEGSYESKYLDENSVIQNGTTITLSGRFENLYIESSLINNGTINITGIVYRIGNYGKFINNGTINVIGGESYISNSSVFENYGKITLKEFVCCINNYSKFTNKPGDIIDFSEASLLDSYWDKYNRGTIDCEANSTVIVPGPNFKGQKANSYHSNANFTLNILDTSAIIKYIALAKLIESEGMKLTIGSSCYNDIDDIKEKTGIKFTGYNPTIIPITGEKMTMDDVIADPLNNPEHVEYTFDNGQSELISPDIISNKNETIYFKLIATKPINIKTDLELKGGIDIKGTTVMINGDVTLY